PSVFAWCLFNETWGFGGQDTFADFLHAPELLKQGAQPAAATKKRPASKDPAKMTSQQWVQSMWELAKKLDPTRLVEDMSVCHWEHLDYYAHGDTDINSWHFYIDDYDRARQHIEKIVESTYLGSTFNYVPGYQHKGQPLIN